MNKEVSGYSRLWQAVILQLIRDLFIDCNLKDKNKRSIAISLRMKSSHYLANNQEELKIICDYAGFDYSFIVKKIQFLKKNIEFIKLRNMNKFLG